MLVSKTWKSLGHQLIKQVDPTDYVVRYGSGDGYLAS